MSALRSVIYAGEVFPPSALRALMAALPGARFENAYGPAEVNAVTVHRLSGPPAEGQDVPVGVPWPGVEVLIVDDDEQPVPDGEMGALWVSAPTRMREYWNRPDLTEATRRRRRTGPDWYVTGDLATRDEHGVIWFHGRRDHQVKLRGIRVELEGVEAALTDHPEVRQAVAGPWGAEPGTLAATVVVGDRLHHRSSQSAEVVSPPSPRRRRPRPSRGAHLPSPDPERQGRQKIDQSAHGSHQGTRMNHVTTLTDALCEFIDAEVSLDPDTPVEPDTDLLTTGLVDSLGAMEIVHWIEESPGISTSNRPT